jgi:hypothetical protein
MLEIRSGRYLLAGTNVYTFEKSRGQAMKFRYVTGSSNERWIQAGAVAGIGLALLLLGNTFWTYQGVTRRMATDRVRREAGEQVAAIERALQSGVDLSSAIGGALQPSEGRIPGIRVREVNGNVIAAAGALPFEPLSGGAVRERMRSRQPAYELRRLATGDFLVETFPFRIPAPVTLSAPASPRPFALIDVAALVKPEPRDGLPFRRSLIINLSAAAALLVALAAMGLKMRSYFSGQRLEREAEVAREVQRDLLPGSREFPQALEVAVEWQPASQVGGDLYDVFPAEDGKIAFAVGDVSGKGIPAALLMAVLHGAIRTSRWTGSAESHEAATRQLNRLLCENAARHRFASLFWGCLDPQSGRLDYVNAGHLPPLLFHNDSATMERLTTGGPVLGLLPEARYYRGSAWLAPGDTLVLYSDGIVEVSGAKDNQFEEDRLIAAVDSCGEASADAIRDAILRSVRRFSSTPELEDDQTLMVIRFAGAPAAHRERMDLAAA